MIMMLVLLLVALLLIVALAVITGANSAAQSATAVSIKYRVLNAAEGASNSALADLAENPAESDGKHLTGTLNGVNWDAWIRKNQLLSSQSATYTDPVTGNTVTVPAHSAYFYGVASENGGHTTYVEAIAASAPPLTLPPGVLNAARDVLDLQPMAINSDPGDLLQSDANVFANRNIMVSGQPSTVVQGTTSAVGTNQLPGQAGQISPGQAQRFPLSAEVSQAVRTANLAALAGQQLDAIQMAQAGSKTYTGNTYVNGDLVLTNSSVTFAQGTYVYINGNLCIAGTGQLNDFNTSANEIVVSGNVQVENGGYAATLGQNTLMIALGSDGVTDPCFNENHTVHAVDFATIANTVGPIGTFFAPNGSIDITGGGAVAGALDAGIDIRLEGTNTKLGMQYDSKQANTTMNTGTLDFQSYIEY